MTEAIFLKALGWAILNSLWQLAILWVIYQICLAIRPGMIAANKSRLASGMLLGGFLWFVCTLFTGLFNLHIQSDLLSINASPDSIFGIIDHSVRVSLPYASIIYLVLLILPLLRFTRNYRYVKIIRTTGLHKIAPEWRLFAERISGQMGLSRKVQIWVSEWVNSPVTIGFLKPVILIPIAAVSQLSPSQLEAILLHELSHIQKMDYLVNLLINFVRVILYFNPFANAFIRIVETEREKSCDEMVLQFQYNSYDYADALLTLEKLHRHNHLLVLAAAGKNNLLTRIETIMGLQKKERFHTRRALAILAGLITMVLVNTLTAVSAHMPYANEQAYASYTTNPDTDQELIAAELPEQVNADPIRQSAGFEKNEQKSVRDQSTVQNISGIYDHNYLTARCDLPLVTQQVLSKSQEMQVKQAMVSSKKLLENVQLRQMENNLADVFSEDEKTALKNEWRSEMNRFDWSKLEFKLKQAYEQVDWDRVNLQLNSAIRQIQLDSLANVYNRAICELNLMQTQLNQDSLIAIPDTDITLKTIAEKQQMIRNALEQIKPASRRTIKL